MVLLDEVEHGATSRGVSTIDLPCELQTFSIPLLTEII